MTVGDAKTLFAGYSAHRNWTDAERMMIPQFPDTMPVMPETMWLAEAITNTHNSANPVVNAMWRGVTSYGKSTGVKQLASILNVPLLILTCHPNMEISEFKSTYVPYSGSESVEMDMSGVIMPHKAQAPAGNASPYFQDAFSHVKALTEAERAELMDTTAFFGSVLMDSDSACELLLGRTEEMPIALSENWLEASNNSVPPK